MSDEFLTATEKNEVRLMRRLLSQRRGSPNMVTENGVTPLCIAIRHGHPEAVTLLLDQGARVNASFGRKKTFPLSWALKYRQEGICRVLIGNGANFDDLSAFNWSPLFYLWPGISRHEPATHLITMLRTSICEFPLLHEGITDTEG